MKILGSDYDGTLNYGGIRESKLFAIRKWRSAGHKIGVVTGRGKGFREALLQQSPQLRLDFFVECTGGYIVDGDGAVIYEARCNDVPLSELVADLFDFGCKFAHIHSAHYMCVVASKKDVPSDVSEEDAYLLKECPRVDYFNQVSVMLPSVEEASAVVQKINDQYSNRLSPLQNEMCIDIVPAGVNKAQGMYRVMEFFGCSQEDVITVGDNINDVDMIRAFHSYAMNNGVDEIKRLADGLVRDITEIFDREL